MSEMFEAIDARHAAAEEERQAAIQAERDAFAEWQRQEELRLKAAHRRADLTFAFRAALFIGVVLGLMAATNAGLMAEALAGGLLLLGFTWFGFQAGAWWQYRFRKGGVHHG